MSDQRLRNKVLVIVGGTTGLGLSASRAIVAAGAKLVIVGKDDRSVSAAAAIGGDTSLLIGDATEPATAELAIDRAIRDFGDFHGLYHVAGGSGRSMGDGPLHELTNAGWTFTQCLNLETVFFSNRAAVQALLRLGHGGSILNVGSVLATSPAAEHFATHAYAAAKSALIGLVRSSAAYYAPKGIRFNVLAPGLIDTQMSQRAIRDPRIREYAIARQPLDGGRIGVPTDLDDAVVYFLSDDSRFVTGQVLAVDGGWSVIGTPLG